MKKFMALLLSLVMVFSMSTVAFAADDGYFYDISKSKNEDAIEYLYDLGVIEGYGNHKYGPTDTLTRAQACAIIVRAMLTDEEIFKDYDDTFVDVNWNEWYREYVDTAYRHSYMHGYGKGYFGPTDQVTYAQFATIITNVLGYDATKLSGEWPANVFYIADKLDLFDNTTKTALASDPITREDAAQMIYNALDANMVEVVDGKLVATTATLADMIDSDYSYDVTGTVYYVDDNTDIPNTRGLLHFWMHNKGEWIEVYGYAKTAVHAGDVVTVTFDHTNDVLGIVVNDCIEDHYVTYDYSGIVTDYARNEDGSLATISIDNITFKVNAEFTNTNYDGIGFDVGVYVEVLVNEQNEIVHINFWAPAVE